MQDKELIRGSVRNSYAKIAKGEKSGCCAGGCGCAPADSTEASARAGYTVEEMQFAAREANMGLGCGNPTALAQLKEGETLLDLGSGGGFDCFLARRRVGETGRVIGVDMTPDMISLARENAKKSGYENVDFYLGEIEHLPVADGTVDVITSNCVINLSPDKPQVFSEAYRVLKKGGRLCISDILATGEIPKQVRANPELVCACIGGAEKEEEVKRMLTDAGFSGIAFTPNENSREMINSWAPDVHAEEYLSSFIIRALK